METEARKRKIVHKSSDRLALISRRLETLDTASPPSTPVSGNPERDGSNLSRAQSAPPGWSDAHIDSDREHQQQHHEAPPRLPPQLVSKEVVQVSASTDKNEAESSSSAVDTKILSTKASSSNGDADYLLLKPAGRRRTFLSCFTAKEINSSILSSEDTRVFCSIMVAFLVVIAYANLPHHIVKSESIIASRPLYVLLLTDAMIVFLRVINAKHTDSESGGMDANKLKKAMNSGDDETENWDGALKMLEYGLVMYQTVRAVYIDCSFYLVIVICGFSFM